MATIEENTDLDTRSGSTIRFVGYNIGFIFCHFLTCRQFVGSDNGWGAGGRRCHPSRVILEGAEPSLLFGLEFVLEIHGVYNQNVLVKRL